MLRLLKRTTLSEWEILSSLHSRYGLNPSAREFQRLENTLLGEGYALVDGGKHGNKLKITTAGLGALRRLEEEHQTVVSNATPPQVG